MKIKDKIKRLSAVVCAVLVGSLSCLPAFATHNPSTSVDISSMTREETQDYVHGTSTTFTIPNSVAKSDLDNITNVFDVKGNKIPAKYNSKNEVERFGTRLENIVNSVSCDLSDIGYDVFIFAGSETLTLAWFYYVKTDTACFNVSDYNGKKQFKFNEKCFYSRVTYVIDDSDIYNYSSSANMSVDYETMSNGFIALDNDYVCLYYSNNCNTKAYTENGNNVFEVPEPWQYSVIYEPVLSENMVDITEIKLTISLGDLSKRYCEENYMQVDILPFVSTVNASEDLKGSFDNAKAVIPTKSNYTDGFTLTASNGAEGGTHMGYWTFDKAYGNNVLYTLCEDNNYSLTLTLPITSTPLISNTDYYFNIVGIQHCYLLMKTTGNMPARAQFKGLYENGINSSLYDDIKILSANIMSSEKFTFSSVLKKTDNKNGVGEGGLIMSTTNSLNTTPSTVNPYGTDNYISYGEVDDYNESIKEEYYPNYNNSSAFDTSSLDGLFNSADGFFDFLEKGFSILPSFIWLLIAGFIAVLIFLRVMGR